MEWYSWILTLLLFIDNKEKTNRNLSNIKIMIIALKKLISTF